MKWESVSNPSGNEVYHLYKDDKKILSLVLNPFSNTARVECEKEKRVFLIRKEGFRRNKTVLRNEYGIKIGELGQENKTQFITINQERFFYTTRHNKGPELIVYKTSIEDPLIKASLRTQEVNAAIDFQKEQQLPATSHPGLLMALCWYMFLPVTKENTVALAAN